MKKELDEAKLINDVISKFFRDEFSKASLVMDNLKKVMEETKSKYGLNEIYLTNALSRIVEKGFLDHLSSYSETLKKFRKALWNYSDGKITEEELYKTAKRSISKSLSTNTRNAYQCWVLLSLLNLIDGKIMDTEHQYLDELPEKSKFISLSSKRIWYEEIEPNFIIDVSGKFFSIFYEGPGPIKWETENKKFTILLKEYGYFSRRPDIMIYSGKVNNIFIPDEKPFQFAKILS